MKKKAITAKHNYLTDLSQAFQKLYISDVDVQNNQECGQCDVGHQDQTSDSAGRSTPEMVESIAFLDF